MANLADKTPLMAATGPAFDFFDIQVKRNYI